MWERQVVEHHRCAGRQRRGDDHGGQCGVDHDSFSGRIDYHPGIR
jgi:hypothetical protein